MSLLCFIQNGNGSNYSTTVVSSVAQCTNGFVAESSAIYVPSNAVQPTIVSIDPQSINSVLTALFQTYFGFDTALFLKLILWNLLVFVMGYTLGTVLRFMRKT